MSTLVKRSDVGCQLRFGPRLTLCNSDMQECVFMYITFGTFDLVSNLQQAFRAV